MLNIFSVHWGVEKKRISKTTMSSESIVFTEKEKRGEGVDVKTLKKRWPTFESDWNRICSLDKGWLDGEGEKISVLDNLAHLLCDLPEELPQPQLTPTHDGGIDLVWYSGNVVMLIATLCPENIISIVKDKIYEYILSDDNEECIEQIKRLYFAS